MSKQKLGNHIWSAWSSGSETLFLEQIINKWCFATSNRVSVSFHHCEIIATKAITKVSCHCESDVLRCTCVPTPLTFFFTLGLIDGFRGQDSFSEESPDTANIENSKYHSDHGNVFTWLMVRVLQVHYWDLTVDLDNQSDFQATSTSCCQKSLDATWSLRSEKKSCFHWLQGRETVTSLLKFLSYNFEQFSTGFNQHYDCMLRNFMKKIVQPRSLRENPLDRSRNLLSLPATSVDIRIGITL